jgi:cell pole-organizing protein PopZ
MLGGWLNAKLPEMIDRVVQDEIARMNADAAD